MSLKETIDNEFVEVYKNMQGIKKEMEDAASRSKTLTDQRVTDAAWAEVASKQVYTKLGKVENEVSEMNKALLEAKEASAEAQDKEVRRNNIILYHVPENADGNDKHFSEQLLIGMNVGVVEEDIKRVQRLGKRDDTGETSRTCPVLVQASKEFDYGVSFKVKVNGSQI